MGAEIRVGDIGTPFRATVKDQAGVVVDISAASVKQLYFKKPDDTVSTQTAAFVTTGVDGQMQFVSVAGFLDQEGNWECQGHVTLPGGEWKTDIHTFTVHPNLV